MVVSLLIALKYTIVIPIQGKKSNALREDRTLDLGITRDILDHTNSYETCYCEPKFRNLIGILSTNPRHDQLDHQSSRLSPCDSENLLYSIIINDNKTSSYHSYFIITHIMKIGIFRYQW